MTLLAGIHDNVPMATYLSDPAPQPSLSTGAVQTLIERSPAHAYHQHPRLGRAGDSPSARGDLGSAIHSLVLGGPPVQYVGEVTKRSGKDKGAVFMAEDWKTADAQEARDAIRAEGGIPMLEIHRGAIEAAAGNARRVLERFGSGKAEQTMLWQLSNGVWCRGRADFLSDDGSYDIDLKTCDNADPHTWAKRTVLAGGLDIQAALRIIGHEVIGGRTRDVLWLLIEIEPPYGACLVGPGPSVLDLARRKVDAAAKMWRRCLDTGEWPSYRTEVHWFDAPGFAEWDFEARQLARAS
jgi:hypothetical protein